MYCVRAHTRLRIMRSRAQTDKAQAVDVDRLESSREEWEKRPNVLERLFFSL